MSKTIHIHLGAPKKTLDAIASAKRTADASSVAAAEKAIAVQQRLIDGCTRNGRDVPPILQQRLAFLKEELDKAKAQMELE